MPKYTVVRQHLGDRMYMPGDERELAEAEAKHLIPRVLAPVEQKAEPAPSNKAESAPANKADTGRKAKRKAGQAEGDDQ